jgi:hypothetical protein
MDFNKAKQDARQNAGGPSKSVAKVPDTQVTEPRCLVCQHKKRKLIDKYLARGTGYTDLERTFGVSRRSISNHDKNHLNLEDAAIRAIVAQEAQGLSQADFEEGVRGILRRKVYMETAVKKAMDQLLSGDVVVEPRDALAIIEKLDKLENEHTDAMVAQMRLELASYIEAMKQIVPSDLWDKVLNRTQELIQRQTLDNAVEELKSGDNED